MSATNNAITKRLIRQRPHFQGVVALQALWSAAAVISPASGTLVWAAVPPAILFAAFTQRTNRRRTPTVANAIMTYINMALVEGGFSHWALGASEVLRDKLAILTIMGVGAAFLETRAWLDEVLDLRERILHPQRPAPTRRRAIRPRRRTGKRVPPPSRPGSPRRSRAGRAKPRKSTGTWMASTH